MCQLGKRSRATRSPHKLDRLGAPAGRVAPEFLGEARRWVERRPARAAPRLQCARTGRRSSRLRGVGRYIFHKKRSTASAIMLTEPYQPAMGLASRGAQGSAPLSGPEHSIGQNFADGSLQMARLGKDFVLELGMISAKRVHRGDTAHRSIEFVEELVGNAGGD